jgi:hypothetical protein
MIENRTRDLPDVAQCLNQLRYRVHPDGKGKKVKLYLCLTIKHYAMKAYGGMDV